MVAEKSVNGASKQAPIETPCAALQFPYIYEWCLLFAKSLATRVTAFR